MSNSDNAPSRKEQGVLIVLCGPSGVGKSTISRMLSQELGVSYTVSVTTREERPGDDKGKTYEYVDKKEFYRRLDNDQYLEYARVYGEYYATPRHPALDYLDQGRDVLLEIDVQGALQVRYHYPKALTIFLLPPNEQTLLQRLNDRGRDDADEINKRFRAAKREIHMARGSRAFDFMIVNDQLDEAVAEIIKIVKLKKADF
jgi:guanylate kinase